MKTIFLSSTSAFYLPNLLLCWFLFYLTHVLICGGIFSLKKMWRHMNRV